MPSLDDPGMCPILPSFKLADFLVSGLKGKIKNFTLATNPMRLSYRGKEIVFSRFDYLKKLKKNTIEKIADR